MVYSPPGAILITGVIRHMEYLVVLFSLASMGAAFAAAKVFTKGKKDITRLEL
jgi:hypothetical protein